MDSRENKYNRRKSREKTYIIGLLVKRKGIIGSIVERIRI